MGRIKAFHDSLPADVRVLAPADAAPLLTDWRGHKTGHADLVLQPDSVAAVQQVVKAAISHGVGLVPQGGNTGLVGASVPEPRSAGPVALISMARMRRIVSVDPASLVLVAEAGAILADVHSAAEAAGARFPLSLGAKGSATVGGLVSTNAGGTQVIRHGPMRSLVLGLQAVLADGSLLDQLAPLRKDNTGYDIKQLLIGGEGTLGIVTAVALKLAPPLEHETSAWVALNGAGQALSLLGRLRAALGETIESFELIGRDALQLVVARVPGLRPPIAGDFAVHVLLDAAVPRERLEAVLADAIEAGEVADAVVASSIQQARDFWALRESIPEAERLEGGALKNDISVPVELVPAFLDDAFAMFAADYPECRPLMFGHLGDGNLHLNLRPPPGAQASDWLQGEGEAARRRLHDLIHRHGGSISAEHGIGTLKAAELRRLGDPGKLAAMRAIKAALDPAGIMNPGKLFVAP